MNLWIYSFTLALAAADATPLEIRGLPSFKILGNSRSNVPDMTVQFEDGRTHEIVLEPYSNSPCNFIGQFRKSLGSVAVTGCLENPGDKMHITMLSDLNTKSAMYELDHDGHVVPLENPMKHQTEPSGQFPLKNRKAGSKKCGIENEFELDDDAMGDEEIDLKMELEATAQTSAAVTWPAQDFVYLKLGYDQSLQAQLDSEKTNFNAWADAVMTHVQTYYRHATLPTKIQFKYDLAETIYKNQYMPSTDSLDAWSAIGQSDADPKVDLYAAFGKDPQYYGTVGLAWVGGACNKYIKTSFNEWRKTPVETAMIVAHEIGHNLGMSHDFDKKHGGPSGKCNGQGIMSYGDAPSKWSDCSVNDFIGYYNAQQWGDKCMKSWAAYVKPCGDNCPGNECTTTPDYLCSKTKDWGGCDGYLVSYFKKECKKTCGVCK